MKLLNRFITDFKTLSRQDMWHLFLLIAVTFFIFNQYLNIYLDQSTPCKIMSTFIDMPLPAKKQTQIIPNNYNKLSVFSITCITDDPSIEYEERLKKHLYSDAKKYNDSLFVKNSLNIVIKRSSSLFSFNLYQPLRGAF